MKALAHTFRIAAIVAVLTPSAFAVNSVVVESRNFQPGQTACTVGIWLSNEVGIAGLTLPLEVRSTSGGAFHVPAGASHIWAQPGRRVDNSPLGSADSGGAWPAASVTLRFYSTPAGNCLYNPGDTASRFVIPVANVDGISPDGVSCFLISQGDSEAGDLVELPPGADHPSRDSASWVYFFDANEFTGCLEIDTCCVAVDGRLSFIDAASNFYKLQFTKATICLVPCQCDCHANPAACASPEVNILDVVSAINTAFRGFGEINDNHPLCPMHPTDLNCDGFTSIVDVIKMIDVAFRGANAATVVCDPCP